MSIALCVLVVHFSFSALFGDNFWLMLVVMFSANIVVEYFLEKYLDETMFFFVI